MNICITDSEDAVDDCLCLADHTCGRLQVGGGGDVTSGSQASAFPLPDYGPCRVIKYVS